MSCETTIDGIRYSRRDFGWYQCSEGWAPSEHVSGREEFWFEASGRGIESVLDRTAEQSDEIVQLQADRDRWKLTAETIADNNYPTPTNAAISTYIDLGEQANL